MGVLVAVRRRLPTPVAMSPGVGEGLQVDGSGPAHDLRSRTVPITFPGESTEYRAARDRLLRREADLRRELEAVAAERRALPPGGEVPEDYAFTGAGPDGAPATVRLS